MDLVEEKLGEHHLDEREVVDVVVRFAGDSGDGMQLTGSNFTEATALYGNDLSTFPDFPAEIRAPIGATFGVSAFQIYFGAEDVTTAGDALDVLVAMNPAALVTNIANLVDGGLVIIDSGAFTAKNLQKAKYENNPLEDGSLDGFRVLAIDISKHVLAAVESFELGHKGALRCKNMWTLGLVMWLFDRDREATIESLQEKFSSKPEIAGANIAALNAGHAYGETAELPSGIHVYKVPKAKVLPGTYRNVTGTTALAWGLIAGSELAEIDLLFASYPITPASGLLHELASRKEFRVSTFQAEDEIAAVCSAIGASFAGALGITSSAGPGIALKAEGISLAAATELPLIVVNTQRGGPSTGLPTKTEQSDLLMSVYGRHGDTPMPVISTSSPTDCFEVAIEAVRLATKYMTPVMLLSDGYLANAAEPWKIPDTSTLTPFPVKHHSEVEGFKPSLRDEETLARVWAKPGTPGMEHRLGGIESSFETGDISYDPENHQKMTDLRKAKIDGIAKDIPDQQVCLGNDSGKLAVVGWGSTFGAIHQAVKRARNEGLDVSHIQVRYISPLPANLEELLRSFDAILIPEMNTGQFIKLIRSEFLIDAEGVNKVAGQPFKIGEILAAIHEKFKKLEGKS
ncbi:MAG: 2-oxoacid:acceptor oxidoreductase subunit alpha [Gammaproteobacteria bacterium]|jgi:2-oxoglutarate ferredoxin oxidoreductase subunit alpha|nr:2-oxoacid:acceptor oxidoreductase subunit alpha [Gammaproteobacteria bacterium]MBT3859053.1 2-oxoacid:acceptor oxidoreductase subunit alpha [Gammaproteobacteria bacterium]MBT3987836.1 2-oxoacid:acceptor oxidoreductase subunit alpha [Gammaproteobacteria bacterium]MBT4581517.1 2-oxoacid:acceptor oxidoreductase subunit alpha [Gammaproteobacteria bacterium]MBT4659852.1 2-oxoacid:acceptor oxidoreductase subunit alpha [Gammaproteobacteria bacterium]